MTINLCIKLTITVHQLKKEKNNKRPLLNYQPKVCFDRLIIVFIFLKSHDQSMFYLEARILIARCCLYIGRTMETYQMLRIV